GVEYRVRTFSVGGASIALGAPTAETQRRIAELHWRVVGICTGVIVGTVVIGWFFSLIMIDPFRLLAQQARAINAQSKPDEVHVRGVREAVEIGEAVEGMLARIGDEQARTKAALESARDFAAVASHELRTPLTAMRTNLEVLSTLDLGDEQRKEVISDTIRTQSRIEATLTALERLAQGELTTTDDFVSFDITELLDRAAHDAERTYPNLSVALVPSPAVSMVGLPAGLRLVIDNAIANAVRHGGATEVLLAVNDSPDALEITVDDNGSGVPQTERVKVFERFERGSKVIHSGSGLGLALVAQQAELHRGTASLDVSPLGGARLALHLAANTG
ncbi:MAG: HAMP domain-containing histidine kinase, partial [Mycobacterium sp.]|nr:HAMP domain-containing histidine kinase [Mycobacterium sp.]